MSGLALYARSRQVPLAFGALLACAVVTWLVTRSVWSIFPAALALATGVSVAAIGLSGQDVDLDRSAARPWPPLRLAHLLLIGAVALAAVLAVQAFGTSTVDLSPLVRDAAGLLGLAGIAATFFGGQFGWSLPFAWFAIAPFVPQDDPKAKVLAWFFQPAGSAAANWTAWVLFAVGVTLYAAVGARR